MSMWEWAAIGVVVWIAIIYVIVGFCKVGNPRHEDKEE